MPALTRYGAAGAAIVPAELHHADALRAVADLKPGEYGWVPVWVDAAAHAFVFANEPVRDAQGEHWPHLVQRSETGFSARLFTQRVRRIDRNMSKAQAVIAIEEIEL